MSADPDERFNETCPPSVICAACFQSAHTQRPDQTGCQCSCHPEQAATVTPGQAAPSRADVARAVRETIGTASVCWNPMDCTGEFDEQQANRIADELIGVIDRYVARKSGSERVAELVTEGNELRRERDRLADELQKAEATIADYRDALCAMQAERDNLQREPAVVTAGTEHLAEKIRGLAIPDEEN